MAPSSRQHKGVKRRKELDRQARQKEKRERRAERKSETVGGGPPIDWEAAEAGPTADAAPKPAPEDSQEPQTP